MASKFIFEPKRPIHYPVIRKDDSILQRTAADQAHGLQWQDVAFEAESARARQKPAERFRVHHHFYFLLAYQRVREIHITLHVEFISGIDTYAPVAFDDFHRLLYFQISPL